MSKNFREQAAYDYIHDKKEKIKDKHFWSIMRKWWRHNCEVGESRMIRNREKKIQQDKELEIDLINYYNERGQRNTVN